MNEHLKEKTANQIAIPEQHQQICRELAAIAKKYKLNHLTASYDPEVFDEWRGRIEMSWSSGRHRADANKLSIVSTMRVNTQIEEEENGNT